MRQRDDRAQALQVGAVILFGFLVVAFAGYQAVSVPQQNGEVELQHSMQVTEQMQEFRSDVVEAASTGSARAQAFKLGTTYPARLFAVNPAPASGRLATTTFGGGEYVLDAPGANLEDICGLSREGDATYDVTSKALVYEPNYNQYTQAPTVVYENTVSYRQFPDETILDSGQRLIDGTTLTLTPLTGDVSAATSATRTVDLLPGAAGVGATNTDTDPDVNYVLTVPTALDVDDWQELLADQSQVESVTEATGGGVDIELAPGEYTVICPPVGLGSAPENDPTDVLTRSGDGGADLNPGDSGTVQLSGISSSGGTVDLTFTNDGDTVDLTSARYNFYYAGPSGGAPTSFDLEEAGSVVIPDLQLRGETKEPTSTVEFEGGGATTTVTTDFGGGVNPGDYYVIRLRFSDGQDSLYFVDVPSGGDGGDGGDGGGSGGPPAEQNGIQYDGNLGTTSSSSGIQFGITNLNSNTARINNVEIESRLNGNNDRIWNTGSSGLDGNEVDIRGGQNDGYIEARESSDDGPDAALTADGGNIAMDSQANLAGSGGQSSATVTVGSFGKITGQSFSQYDFGGLERVAATEDWDVRITLKFQSTDIGDITFYFRET